ncbi:MAG: hypothetical protein PHY34_02820 [Patescibacteria group bacterium]|nr:hypothetical protein [Patescibacteria group bacterium]MDD5715391.1 hypothetical protein [Patescibacteria group bacterium]
MLLLVIQTFRGISSTNAGPAGRMEVNWMNETRARGTIIDGIASLTGKPVPEGFQVILTGYDHLDAPCGIIPGTGMRPAPFNGIIVPEWIWSQSSVLMLYAYTGLELVNCFFMQQITQVEQDFAAKLATLSAQFTGKWDTPEYRRADETLLYELHVKHGYENVYLYRKLISDPEVFDWFSHKQQWDPNGIIYALSLLRDEAPRRNIVKPWLYSREQALQLRINHLVLLRDNEAEEARSLREPIIEAARRIDPSVIVPA